MEVAEGQFHPTIARSGPKKELQSPATHGEIPPHGSDVVFDADFPKGVTA